MTFKKQLIAFSGCQGIRLSWGVDINLDVFGLVEHPKFLAFMDACDELGLLFVATIPGWQFCGKLKGGLVRVYF